MRLATKIIASSLVVIVFLTAIAGYFSVRNKYHEFELVQRKLAQATATTIRQELTRAWQDEGLSGVVRFLDQANSASNGALQVRWVWLDAQARPNERPRLLLPDASIPFGDSVSLVADNDSGQRFLFTYVPVQLSSNRPGALEFAESLAPLERQMWRDVLLTLGLIGAVAAVSIATAYFTGINWVARPLEQLIAKTQRIGRGDFSVPLALATRDELSQLALALNEMCEQLSRQQDEIACESQQRLLVLDQLRHSDRLKTVGRLAAGVGHELGTPLNVIAGRASLIVAGKLSESQILASAQVIKEEANRVTEIVRQLLDFARRRPPKRCALDLVQLITRTIELLLPIAERSSVRLKFDFTATQDEEASATTNADSGQLQQVLTNVIVNAIQAMPQGGNVEVALASTLAREPAASFETPKTAYWRVSVIDEGTGIRAEHLGHVFEPFFTTKDVNEGTGLGLSIAYGIVLEHQGWIDVSSQQGAGSRFDVYLPQGP